MGISKEGSRRIMAITEGLWTVGFKLPSGYWIFSDKGDKRDVIASGIENEADARLISVAPILLKLAKDYAYAVNMTEANRLLIDTIVDFVDNGMPKNKSPNRPNI